MHFKSSLLLAVAGLGGRVLAGCYEGTDLICYGKPSGTP
jgi:hypothetical protein